MTLTRAPYFGQVERVAPRVNWLRRMGRAIAGAFRPSARRAYEGASRGRRFQGWTPTNTTANTELFQSLEMLRARSRDMVRNDPHAARMIEVLAGNLVGAAGLTVRASSGRAQLDERAMALWKQWVRRCDVGGVIGLSAVFKVAARELFEAGEVLIRRHIVTSAKAAEQRLNVPMRLEVIEADQLDFWKNQLSDGNGRIIHGVEMDGDGLVVAYWILPEHPGGGNGLIGQAFTSLRPSIRVPASEVIHLFQRLRAGQVRGVPTLAPVMTKLRDLGDYDQAERLRKKLEACVMAFITPSDEMLAAGADQAEAAQMSPVQDSQIGARAVNADGAILEDMQPGMVVTLRNGKSVSFHTPQVASGTVEYESAQLRDVAVGSGLTYEMLTGDLRSVNYSSYRAGLIEFRRMIESLQWELFVPVCCERVWDWWTEIANLAGRLQTADIAGEWSTARWMSVDPYKDAVALQMNVRNGFIPLPEAIAEGGFHPETAMAQVAKFNELLDRLGIVLDSDPRHPLNQGDAPANAQQDPSADPAATTAPAPAKAA